ncbi:hypothetical protein BDZ94DRAFT_1324684 [Collybia nuda]|uniref:Chromatin modification-related protein n=1 Tax=Collybia nuda TaxID=64659 RepID=A0A9P5XZE8_9AGAR|nr:hypothetical protein BDZ94DRAFT_1324684 [Collybia nuda]
MSLRKRRKSQTIADVDDEDIPSVIAEEVFNFQGRTEKEREVWDAFREEHFEATEQLPLSLHRQYALIQELEQQSITHMANLLSTLERYITKRRTMIHKIHSTIVDSVEQRNGSATKFDMSDRGAQAPEETPTTSMTPLLNEATPKSGLSSKILSPWKRTPITSSEHTRTPHTTRQMLSHVGYLTEELLRASDEKVNLAQAVYESINRHALILEQAVKEQEASISFGARPGHLEALSLPELVPPRWAQMTPTTPNPDDDIGILLPDESLNADNSHELPPEVKGRRRRFRGKRGKATVLSGHSDVQETLLTITLPGQGTAGDSEETFCRCGRVSYGAMVGCDNDKCEGQWFHLGCVGLTELPTAGIWYCSPECRAVAEAKSTATRKRKRK